MASLTDSYFTYNTPENSRPNPKKDSWFDAVYLCIEKTTQHQSKENIPQSNGIVCYKFDSFEKAEKYENTKQVKDGENAKYIILPICKWTPFIIHKPIIKYKLDTAYSIKNITIFHSVHK